MTEIMVWLVRCGLVAAVLTAGAWLWATAARWSGRSARWAWLGALAGSVTIPLLLPLLPEAAWQDAVPAVGVVRLDALTVAATTAAERALDPGGVAIGVWVVLSTLLAAYTAALLVRLNRARRSWQPAEVDGAAVLLSRNTGPAAVGIGRGAVVIPGWALELDAELRRLMLLHEREHVAAGDPRVLLGGLALVALMPWHPLVWLQFVRLRNAIELDCDARVLRRGVDPARYGSLLLEVGRRRGGGGLVLATFAEPRALLEERIRRIAAWPVARRPVRAAALSVIALALFSSALLARVRVESNALPTSVLQTLGLPATTAPQPLATDTPPPDPRLTPYTQAPVIQNTAAVMRQMAERYPAQLRAAGVGGTVSVWVLVGQQGEVRETRLATSSGHATLDEVGVSVARMMEFVPARNGERVVQAWVEVPLTFSPLAHSVAVNAQPLRQAAPSGRGVPSEISRAPTFTPFTVAPELSNVVEVQRSLMAAYPPLLRDAGVGGTTLLWFLIDETGRVAKTQIKESSGHPALDDAAQKVAGAMQFRPAKNRDEDVPVWVAIPIMFTTRESPPRAPVRAPGGDVERELERVPTPPGIGTGPATVGLPRSRERQPGVGAPGTESLPRSPAPTRTPEAEAELPKRPAPELSPDLVYRPPLVQPELKNSDEVMRALMRLYPPLLRDAGIGGTVWMRILVDEDGYVIKQQVRESSGHDALDMAALRLGEIMRFSPGRNGNEVVRSWIDLPILFATK